MPNIQYLVAGGCGGGGNSGFANSSSHIFGGGGGGSVEVGTQNITAGSYTITIGAGGTVNTNGQNTTFNGITAYGGGRAHQTSGPTSGGSGGGAGVNGTGASAGSGSNVYKGANGFSSFSADCNDNYVWQSGGGGGAGGLSSSYIGGVGYSSNISGTTTTYNSGGHGGYVATNWLWDGEYCYEDPSTNIVPSSRATGCGGNGSIAGRFNIEGSIQWSYARFSSAGSSGRVIIRYTTADFGACTGGTITTSGSDTIHTFTSSGTFTAVAGASSGFFMTM